MASFARFLAGGLLLAARSEASPLVGEAEAVAEFKLFKARFRREYADASEEALRAANFRASLERVRAHNSRPGQSFAKGINQFSDMSDEEFEDKVLMQPQTCSATHTLPDAVPGRGFAAAPDLPAHVDWREKGVISEVKNQGHCGSCWTFSSTGCLEAHMAIKYDNWHAPRLSEQQLVDCAQAFDNHGCNGGLPSHAFEYLRYSGGLDTEFSYAYTAKDGTCSFKAPSSEDGASFEPMSAGIGVKVPGGSVNLTVGDEALLQATLAEVGPVSIAFQVSGDFRDYSHGVYSSKECKNGPGDVNHAVLAVGYGTDPDTKMPYWLVKNSWDYSWGNEGFFKIEAFKNMCGVADCMSYPDLYGAKLTQEKDETVVV